MTSFAIGRSNDPGGSEPTVEELVSEYDEYVREQYAVCRGCPVVRSGPRLIRSMLEWKATHLVYFLADRGTLVGDVEILADATDHVFYGYVRPADLLSRVRSAVRQPSDRQSATPPARHASATANPNENFRTPAPRARCPLS